MLHDKSFEFEHKNSMLLTTSAIAMFIICRYSGASNDGTVETRAIIRRHQFIKRDKTSCGGRYKEGNI